MAYMESFPEGAVRQEFNCVNCKHFITRYGALVSVDENYKIHSYWEDIHAEGMFAKVENIDLGFEVEVELNGVVHTYVYDKDVPHKSDVSVLDFTSNGREVVFTKEHLSSTTASKEIWGVKTQNFVEVSAICLSPNYWGNNKVGAKHYFFMLKDCKNPDAVRGYFNEYLKDELTKNHKRVFEVLASKALTPYDDNQMSGLGFIATSRNSLMVRVDSGKIYKVNI